MDRSASGRRPLVDMSWSLERCVVVRLSMAGNHSPPPQTSAASLPAAPATPPRLQSPPRPPPPLPRTAAGATLRTTPCSGPAFGLHQRCRTPCSRGSNKSGWFRPGYCGLSGLCGFSGPWLPVPRGTQAFSSQLGPWSMDATEGPRASTHCWTLATRLDMQPGGYFMSRLDRMWDEGDMHAAWSPIVDKNFRR